MIDKWISNASTHQLKHKIEEYKEVLCFGGRDTEIALKIITKMENEIERRRNCASK